LVELKGCFIFKTNSVCTAGTEMGIHNIKIMERKLDFGITVTTKDCMKQMNKPFIPLQPLYIL